MVAEGTLLVGAGLVPLGIEKAGRAFTPLALFIEVLIKSQRNIVTRYL